MLEGQQQEASFRLQVSVALSFSRTGQVSAGFPSCFPSLLVGQLAWQRRSWLLPSTQALESSSWSCLESLAKASQESL